MDQIEKLSMKGLYRGILKMVKTYPSKNRDLMRIAIIEDVRDWKKIENELEIKKA
jgi:hypothetical protein